MFAYLYFSDHLGRPLACQEKETGEEKEVWPPHPFQLVAHFRLSSSIFSIPLSPQRIWQSGKVTHSRDTRIRRHWWILVYAQAAQCTYSRAFAVQVLSFRILCRINKQYLHSLFSQTVSITRSCLRVPAPKERERRGVAILTRPPPLSLSGICVLIV